MALHEWPSFTVFFDGIVPGANKYMATLWNGSASVKLVLKEITLVSTQTGGVSGTVLNQELRRILARTAGSPVPISAENSLDTETTGVAADSNSSNVVDGALIRRFIHTGEEVGLTGSFVSGILATLGGVVYRWIDGTRGLTLQPGQGLSVKNITASVTGSCGYLMKFVEVPLEP